MSLIALTVGAVLTISAQPRHDYFGSDEKQAIQQFWFGKGRYAVRASDQGSTGPFQVRLTPEGSRWIYSVNKARGMSKGAQLTGGSGPFDTPGASVSGTTGGGTTIVLLDDKGQPMNAPAQPQQPAEMSWDAWIDAKVAYDRYLAACDCEAANSALLKRSPRDIAPVADPGPIPSSLLTAAGPAPLLATKARPLQHTVNFDDFSVTLTDNVDMRPKYAFYRFAEGVMRRGTPVKQLSQSDVADIFQGAGITETQQHVFGAVSMLEGGFDSLNTYDTGFVSVGLLQFACLQAGSGSLGAVLKAEKSYNPSDFQSDFRRFGIDVDDSGLLVIVSPADGREMIGQTAALEIIGDKRLASVFARAGAVSKSFRIAQLMVAKQRYFPADDVITVTLGGSKTSLRVGDFIRSEAGLATLMDRKVNTGNLGPLATIVQGVIDQTGARSVDDLANSEATIISGLTFRHKYLGDANLSQPSGVVIGRRSSMVAKPARTTLTSYVRPLAKQKPVVTQPASLPTESEEVGGVLI